MTANEWRKKQRNTDEILARSANQLSTPPHTNKTKYQQPNWKSESDLFCAAGCICLAQNICLQ